MQRAAIFRLESYLMHLTEVKAARRSTVTSEELASVVGVSSSRVRQDLIRLQIVGKPRSGYDVCELEMLIYSALGLLTAKGLALVGYGNLGRALVHSGIWDHAGFALKAIFDTDRAVVGQVVGELTVRHIAELHGVVKTEGVVSACLTVPGEAAQAVANLLVGAGIQGIWNFAPVDLQVPPHIVVENQRLEQGLMTLSHLLLTASRRPPEDAPGKPSEMNASVPNAS
ncbi:MAG TPA: redox-sensing transcriptional repressor Rex [Armatimonadota bacterium]|jgi:redox-sensing transcriptional repressor